MRTIHFKALIATSVAAIFSLGVSGLSAANAQAFNSFSAEDTGASGFLSAHRYEKGVAHIIAGEYEQAIEYLETFERPNFYGENQPDYALGLAWAGTKNWRKAERPLKQTVRFNPDNHHARYLLGLTYANLGRIDRAQRQLTKLDARLADCGDNCDTSLISSAEALRDALPES